MDKVIKAKWVEALRSGRYKQTQGVLHNPIEDSYCCLGVFCDLVTPRSKRWVENDRESFYNITGYIPTELTKEYGIDSSGMFDLGLGNKDYCSLLCLNDIAKLTFDQIADVIEYFF